MFDYIHSVDNQKLASLLAKYEGNISKKLNYFLQVNIGNESQKSGIAIKFLDEFYYYCTKELNLNVVGFMCIPPAKINPLIYFNEMKKLNKTYNFTELSMGMSSDYLDAAKNNATYLRIGSSIFGQRD